MVVKQITQIFLEGKSLTLNSMTARQIKRDNHNLQRPNCDLHKV